MFFFAALPAACTPYEEDGPHLKAIRAVNNSVSVAGTSLYLDYREPSNGKLTDKYFDFERGTMHGGVAASVSVMRSWFGLKDLSIQGSFSRMVGEVPYDGHLYFNPGNIVLPFRSTSRAEITDWGFRLGKGFSWGERCMFTPYLAYGYHTWTRTLPPLMGKRVQEDYSHHTLQFGNRLQIAPWARLVLTVDGRFGTTIKPHIRVPSYHFSQNLGRAPAIDLEAEADWALWRFLHGFIGLRFSHFSYGASAIESGFLEPMSRTDIFSWLAGLRLSFQ